MYHVLVSASLGLWRALVVYLLRRGIFCTETVRCLLYLGWKTKNRRQQNEMSETLSSISDDVCRERHPDQGLHAQ